jgi:translation initiation factor IF-2
MVKDNPKGDQTSKPKDTRAPRQNDTPVADQPRGGNPNGGTGARQSQPTGRATGEQAKSESGNPTTPRQPRQPATAKPTGPAPTRPTTPPGSAADPNRRSGGAPGFRNQPAGRGGNEPANGDEVFNQRVFDPTVSDTVVPQPGGRPAGNRGRSDRPFNNAPARPSSGGSSGGGGGAGNSSSGGARPGGTDQRRSSGYQGRSSQPGRSKGNQGRRPQSSGGARTSDGGVPRLTTVEAPRTPAGAAGPVSEIIIPNIITVRDLADKMHRSPIEVIKTLMNYGMMVPITESIDFDTARIIGEELGVTVTSEVAPEPEVVATPEEAPKTLRQRIMAAEKEENLVLRPPIVTVLGHVDHGKTTLLDAIRETRVVEGEAGGITQHIGAYQVEWHDRKITFLDTPGHEAFTAMRARGAMVTDIAVLVVAADDGVMPQTKEAINHAKAAQVPIVVALNKIDKPQANADRVKQELADNGVLIEEYGGDVMCVPVSAKMRRGIGDLLESIVLAADIDPLRANPHGEGTGTVIESRLDKTRGPMATLLVQNGTLHQGDSIVTGETYAKIRAMYDDKGQPITEAAPATPVQILGFDDVPIAGTTFTVVADDRTARNLAGERQAERRATATQTVAPAMTLESIFAKAQSGQVKELNLILKADVQGSIEPIVNSLERLGDEKLKVKILHQATGNITEGDVMLAVASGAIILGFSVHVEPAAVRLAENEGVDIRQYNIIYNIIEDVQKALTGLLEPVYREVITGHAEVRQVFRVTKVGKVAGSYITDGEIHRNSLVRLKRGGEVLVEDRISTLRRFQEDVPEVKTGFECGINLNNFNDFEVGDILEAYKKERVS